MAAKKKNAKGSSSTLMKIPARRGAATHLRKGQKVKIINTHGSQVVDFWAFNANNPGEFMSMEHCRVWLGRYRPKPGDALITNQRRNILKFLEDSEPGYLNRTSLKRLRETVTHRLRSNGIVDIPKTTALNDAIKKAKSEILG